MRRIIEWLIICGFFYLVFAAIMWDISWITHHSFTRVIYVCGCAYVAVPTLIIGLRLSDLNGEMDKIRKQDDQVQP